MLKFFLLNHQADFDVKWPRGACRPAAAQRAATCPTCAASLPLHAHLCPKMLHLALPVPLCLHLKQRLSPRTGDLLCSSLRLRAEGLQALKRPSSVMLPWPRATAGTIGASIMAPWVERLQALGRRMRSQHRVRDVRLDGGGAVTAVLADSPDGPVVRAAPRAPLRLGRSFTSCSQTTASA